MKRFLFSTFFSFLFLLLTPYYMLPKVHAAESFKTNYLVTYTVQETGVTQGKFEITLTNANSQYYASSYKIAVGFPEITNVKAFDPDGQITPTVIKTSNGFTIDLAFNKKVVGEGNTLPFTITFDTPNVAVKNGSIWEINIPGIDNQSAFSAFTVNVKVPESFGPAAYIKPNTGNTDLTFTKEQLGKSGISIAFGEKQLYSFTLVYHLQNKNVFPIPTEIAIPPTTNYQEVFIESMEPQPSNVLIDKDGNWLAQYRLLPSQKVDVVVKGKVEVILHPRSEDLSPEQKKEYLREKAYWQVQASQIKKLAQELKTPEAIYSYVVKTLQYDFSRVTENKPRLGALKALQTPTSAVCVEFTDLFISLSRAAGIPAREINGYGFTQNTIERPASLSQDTLLHSWPEYYNSEKKTWIMVDPTWANTTGGIDYFHTMDFDHIAFVRKGMESKYPVYAGGYKYAEDKDKKDVQVRFSAETVDRKNHIELYTDLEPLFLSGLPIQGKLGLKNVGSSLLPVQTARIFSGELPTSTSTITFPPVPPYGIREEVLSFHATSFLTNRVYPFTITLGAKQIQRTVTVAPFVINAYTITGGIIFAILIIILLIITFKTRRVSIS